MVISTSVGKNALISTQRLVSTERKQSAIPFSES